MTRPAPWSRGRLDAPDEAPASGEQLRELACVGPVRVEQILSGRLTAAVDYLADVDEWVVVLAGGAALDVAGERVELAAGDWVHLPAGTPHQLVRTEPGTSWLTVTG